MIAKEPPELQQMFEPIFQKLHQHIDDVHARISWDKVTVSDSVHLKKVFDTAKEILDLELKGDHITAQQYDAAMQQYAAVAQAMYTVCFANCMTAIGKL